MRAMLEMRFAPRRYEIIRHSSQGMRAFYVICGRRFPGARDWDSSSCPGCGRNLSEIGSCPTSCRSAPGGFHGQLPAGRLTS
jgi:hypothetical protein